MTQFDKKAADKAAEWFKKQAFVPMPGGGAPGQPVAGAGPMTEGAAAPMDPAMAGGAPPMDPATAGGAPPMDPATAGGAPPMDPAMGGMPPEVAALLGAAGGAPPPADGGAETPAAGSITLTPQELIDLIKVVSGQGGEGGAAAKKTGQKESLSELNQKLDALISRLG